MWKTILAAMLFLQAPGRSPYSMVEVAEGSPPPCQETYSPLCAPPVWSPRRKAWVVVEDWGQGLERYAIIAKALDQVVYRMPRKMPRGQLWRYVLAFAYHESGFRRDVHEGVGAASRGDCKWRTVKLPGGKTKRERVPGSCRSHCLAQIQIGPMGTRATVGGKRPDEIVGLSLERTAACLDVAAGIIDRAYLYCTHQVRGPLASCIVSHYAGGMVKNTDPRILARVKTLNKLTAAPSALSTDVRKALGIYDTVKRGPLAGDLKGASPHGYRLGNVPAPGRPEG